MASNTQKLFHCICQQYLLTRTARKCFTWNFNPRQLFFN